VTEIFRRYRILKQRFSKLIKSNSQHIDWIIEARETLEVLKKQLGIQQ
jgi:hypothetical protein